MTTDSDENSRFDSMMSPGRYRSGYLPGGRVRGDSAPDRDAGTRSALGFVIQRAARSNADRGADPLTPAQLRQSVGAAGAALLQRPESRLFASFLSQPLATLVNDGRAVSDLPDDARLGDLIVLVARLRRIGRRIEPVRADEMSPWERLASLRQLNRTAANKEISLVAELVRTSGDATPDEWFEASFVLGVQGSWLEKSYAAWLADPRGHSLADRSHSDA